MTVSRNSYQPGKGYQQVQFNQDVPLLDSELNELQQIARANVQDTQRVLLGVCAIGDEWKVEPGPTVNSITIKAGTLFYYGEQLKLLQDQTVGFLTTPVINRTDTVFVEFHEVVIDGTQDNFIIDPAVGSETSQRIQLQYVIRVAEGSAFPNPTAGRKWVQLATLNRTTGNPSVTSSMIVDNRAHSMHNYVVRGCDVVSNATNQVTVNAGQCRVGSVDTFVSASVNIAIASNSAKYIVVPQGAAPIAVSSVPFSYSVVLAQVVTDGLGTVTISDMRQYMPLIYQSGSDAENAQLPEQEPPFDAEESGGSGFSTYQVSENIAQYQVVYSTGTSNTVAKADNTTSAKAPAIGMAVHAISSGQTGSFLRSGPITNPAWNWTLQQPIFLGVNGGLTQTPPSADYTVIQEVAYPVSPTTIEFNPSFDFIRN